MCTQELLYPCAVLVYRLCSQVFTQLFCLQQGAEIIRLYSTILGTDGFRKGLDLYFERHDGCAVTCDDFRAAMADANGKDLTSLGKYAAYYCIYSF